MVFFIHLDPFQFVKHLGAGLNLYRLGGLVPEPFDKLLRIFNQLLLIPVSGQLSLFLLFTQLQIPVIIGLKVINLPERNLDGAISHII